MTTSNKEPIYIFKRGIITYYSKLSDKYAIPEELNTYICDSQDNLKGTLKRIVSDFIEVKKGSNQLVELLEEMKLFSGEPVGYKKLINSGSMVTIEEGLFKVTYKPRFLHGIDIRINTSKPNDTDFILINVNIEYTEEKLAENIQGGCKQGR